MARAVARDGRGEEGAYAILFALLMVVFFGFAAWAMDIAGHVEVRQDLHDTLDAAAHAGATHLPATGAEAAQARQTALDYAKTNDPSLFSNGRSGPQAVFWCMVGVSDTGGPNLSHFNENICDPGVGSYDAAAVRCSDTVCAVPCDPFGGDICNTIQMIDEKAVPYAFAPVIGVDSGSTGLLDGAACRGSCGDAVSGDLDVVLVLDRTPSMSYITGGSPSKGFVAKDVPWWSYTHEHMKGLVRAAEGVLQLMEPTRHRAAIGTIGRSTPTPGACVTAPSTDMDAGPWVPVGLSQDYADGPGNVLDPSSPLVVAIECLGRGGPGGRPLYSGWGWNVGDDVRTNLSDPMAAAADELRSNGRPEALRAIIFMTDGEANQPEGRPRTPCQLAKDEAERAKADEIVVITIAYRLTSTVGCDGVTARAQLAMMATDSADDEGCGVAENEDGDNFFCAADPAQLQETFRRAFLQLNDTIRLVRVPD